MIRNGYVPRSAGTASRIPHFGFDEWIAPRPGRYTPAQPWRKQNPSSLPGIEARFPGHPARSLVNIFTELSWLQQ
jgi:hypothetical protein